MDIDQPWGPADATDAIRALAREVRLKLTLTDHAKERMAERDLFMPDVLHVLKYGFVFNDPEASTKSGYFKYQCEGSTPNSNNREVRVVLIPDVASCWIKIVTIMWVD